MRSQKRIRMSLTSSSRSAGEKELTTSLNPTAVGSLGNFFVTYFFFLSPRRRSGERREERGVPTERPSFPCLRGRSHFGAAKARPSPPSDGGEGVPGVASPPHCERSEVGFASGASFVVLLAFGLPTA